MRSPIRAKNFRPRFWPAYAGGALALLMSRPDAGSLAAGLPLLALGVGVRSWAAGHLVKTELFVCSGPYARVRHPFYLGTFLIGTGFGVMLGGWGGVAVLAMFMAWFFFSYFPRKERVEAERLEERYGAVYVRYREAVPPLLPALRPWPEADEGEWQAARWRENNELGTVLACAIGLAIVLGWMVIRG